jgi:protein-S-isoprenylcysteine O-methyltransferase Ste14
LGQVLRKRQVKSSAPGIAALARFGCDEFARCQQSRVYDLLMRLPLLGWSVYCAILQMAGLRFYLHSADPALPSAVYTINIAMRLATIFFLLLMAAAVVLRARPKDKARGVEPRVSAFIGAFIVYSIPLFPRRELSVTTEMAATVLILVGSAAAVVALLQLRSSFSMMAEARRLVTSGPYRFVRHPLYLAEELAVIGLFIQFLSVWTALLLAVQIAFQLRRMHNEEAVLAATFPDYAAYHAKTARLIPGIY